MKYILTSLFLICAISSFSQSDTTTPKTELEKQSIKVGTIIKKKYDDIYKYQPKFGELLSAAYGFVNGNTNLECKALSIKDVASGTTSKGLYLSTYSSDIKRSYVGYIDANEMSGLLKFLEFAKANQSNTEDEGTEYIYSCNDVEFAIFNLKVKKQIQWAYQIKTNRYSDYSKVLLPFKEIETLLQALKDNQSKLQ